MNDHQHCHCLPDYRSEVVGIACCRCGDSVPTSNIIRLHRRTRREILPRLPGLFWRQFRVLRKGGLWGALVGAWLGVAVSWRLAA